MDSTDILLFFLSHNSLFLYFFHSPPNRTDSPVNSLLPRSRKFTSQRDFAFQSFLILVMEEPEDSSEIFNGCCSRDLNQRKRAEPDDDSIELTLGLSLNGRFGLDPASKKLKRSSSVSNLIFDDCGAARAGYAPLGRTCSLPAATDAWRRQKELAWLRCTEARKKRMEKLKNGRVVKEKEKESRAGNGFPDEGSGFESIQPSSQVSMGSSSSGGSDLTVEGTKTNVDGSSSSLDSPQEAVLQKPTAKGNGETAKNVLLDMPHVSTRGYGPNCTKIEGFLYRYRKGDDVKIVCVCHRLFLSPAEFVKHGGGGDVAQPLKHIVVNPFPLL